MHANETSALNAGETAQTMPGSVYVEDVPCTGRLSVRLSWLLTWGAKGGLAVTDQALFAGAQFALNIMLARWLAPAAYGAFAVAYSVFLLVSAAHSALLVEPMMVFGSGKHLEREKKYIGMVLRGHWMLTVPTGLILLTVGFFVGPFYSQAVGRALIAVGVVLPLLLLPWLTRRAFYIELQPGRAAAGGVVFFGALVAVVVWLHAVQILSPATAILAMGVASLLAAGLHLAWLRPQWFHDSRSLAAKEVASEHWNYGRWVLAAVFPSWTLLNLYYLVLPAWFGLKEAGALKAVINLAMPATHSLIAFGALVLPLLVRHRDAGGLRLMRQTVRRITAVFIAGAALYFVFLWLFRMQILHLLYGGKFLEYSGLPVLLVGLVPMVVACSVTLGGALSACQQTDRVFWANIAASAFALTLGLWLTASWDVSGAVGGYLISYGVLVGTLGFFLGKCHLGVEPSGDRDLDRALP